MKQLIVILGIVLMCLASGCAGEQSKLFEEKSKRKYINIEVVNYSPEDSVYRLYGTYRKVFRKYNYTYHDSTFCWGIRIDRMHGIDYFINEFGDTVCEVYTDYTNFPRRED